MARVALLTEVEKPLVPWLKPEAALPFSMVSPEMMRRWKIKTRTISGTVTTTARAYLEVVAKYRAAQS